MSLTDISNNFTEKTLDEILTKYAGVEAKCTNWKFTGGFKKGDFYLSQVFKVEIIGDAQGKPVQVNTVIKSIPKNAGRRKTFRSADFFRNEINFYERVMKQYLDYQAEVQEKAGLSETDVFHEIPRYLTSFSDGVNDFVVLEDLSGEGYGTVSRQTGMDYNHCKLALQTLGRFHGISLAFKHQHPELFEKILEFVEETYYAPKFYDWYKKFQESQIIVATDALEKEFPKTDIEKKGKEFITNNLYKKLVSIIQEKTKYAVVTHGDCWAPNFLFKYSEDGTTPLAVKMIDFQLARYTTPVTDISFFIYSCTTQELREKHYEDLLKAYHDSLGNLLATLGLNAEEIFPYSALLDEIKKKACFGVGFGIESIPFSVMDDDNASDLDAIEGEEAVDVTTVWILKPIKNKEGRLRLANIFKHAVENGYI